MWQYLSTPENSYVTWKLVQTQWGHRDYAHVVQSQEYTLTLGYLQDNSFAALASLSVGPTLQSAWLNIWSSGHCKMQVWQELYEFLFKELGIKSLLAITARKGLIRYARATHGQHIATAKQWFGDSKPGYILQWN